jgi:prepilin-type processing-associated H-X9-DG protein
MGYHNFFFLDGSVKETGMYEKGNRTGKWVSYYPDGSIDYTMTTTYKNGLDIHHCICKQFKDRKTPTP